METKIKNFLLNANAQTFDSTQSFIKSFDDFNVRMLIVYLMFRYRDSFLWSCFSPSQLAWLWQKTGLKEKERENLRQYIMSHIKSFDDKYIVYSQINTIYPTSSERNDEEVVWLWVKSGELTFDQIALLYDEVAEEAELLDRAEKLTTTLDQLFWLRSRLEKHSERYNNVDDAIYKRKLSGQNEEGCLEKQAMQKYKKKNEELISKVKSDTNPNQTQDDPIDPVQTTKKNKKEDNPFDKLIKRWRDAQTTEEELMVLREALEVANNYEQEFWIWVSAETGSIVEAEAWERVKIRDKTNRQKITIWGQSQDGEEKILLWNDIKESIANLDNALFVWITERENIKERKSHWESVKEYLLVFEDAVNFYENPPIPLTDKETKDLWFICVKTADELKEKAWVWMRSTGKQRDEIYREICALISIGGVSRCQIDQMYQMYAGGQICYPVFFYNQKISTLLLEKAN